MKRYSSSEWPGYAKDIVQGDTIEVYGNRYSSYSNRIFCDLPPGKYRLECWGASGGSGASYSRGDKKYIDIYTSNLSTYFTQTNGTQYYFNCNSSHEWIPNNLGIHSTTATTTFKVVSAKTYKITVKKLVSESNFDKLTISVNGTAVSTMNGISGTQSDISYSFSAAVNDTITLAFTKDGSVSASGESVAIIISYDTGTYSWNQVRRTNGGCGGYSSGVLTLTSETTVYLTAGVSGTDASYSTSEVTSTNSGGNNGGGAGKNFRYNDIATRTGGGGGASDVRIGSDSLYARVIVAGGGGGGGGNADPDKDKAKYGGGLASGSYYLTYCATQTSAGTGGSFGIGGSATGSYNYKYGPGGGGGGWYGGGCSTEVSDSVTDYSAYNGGGSGYIYTAETAANYPSGCLLNSSYYLTGGFMYSGNELMRGAGIPSFFTWNSCQTGNSGGGCVKITALSTNNSSCTTDVSGYSSLQNNFFNCGQVHTGDILNCTSRTNSYMFLYPAKYKFECWGARGGGSQDGNSDAGVGGYGGYSVGTLDLKVKDSNMQIYLLPGGKGSTGYNQVIAGGTNGGGAGYGSSKSEPGCSGGGASDIRLDSDTLYSRVIVAGGGGGGGEDSGDTIGYGGGITSVYGNSTTHAYCATQTSAGTGGSFGAGQTTYRGDGGAGGGGWYGGGANYTSTVGADGEGGGGGSGYVYTSATASNYPAGCRVNNSKYYLIDAFTKAGNTSFPSPSGGTETGHNDDGYIRITVLDADDNFYVSQNGWGRYIKNTTLNRYETNIPNTSSVSDTIYFTAKKNLKITVNAHYDSGGLTNKSAYFQVNNLSSQKLTTSGDYDSVTFRVAQGDRFNVYTSLSSTGDSSINRLIYFTFNCEELSYIPIHPPEVNSSKVYYFKNTYHNLITDKLINYNEFLTYYKLVDAPSGLIHNAGDYNFTLSLLDKINTKWDDDTTEDKTLVWTINKATPYFMIEQQNYFILGKEYKLHYKYYGENDLKFSTTSINIALTQNNDSTITIIPQKTGTFSFKIDNALDNDNYNNLNKQITGQVINNPELVKIKKDKILIYPYTGATIKTTLPVGKYKLECWGGSGYCATNVWGQSAGGYATGTLNLYKTTDIYINVGGCGNQNGFNGGGKMSNNEGYGGGASDIRIGSNSLYSRIIVAGGGGSAYINDYNNNIIYQHVPEGGNGGGENGTRPRYNYGNGSGGYYGTQTGLSQTSWIKDTQTNTNSTQEDAYGGFGFGGNGINKGGAGGGGWYGGSGFYDTNNYSQYPTNSTTGGGGGSGYVYTSATASNYPAGCLLNSSYYLNDALLKDKNNVPSIFYPTSAAYHIGSGVVKITVLDGPVSEYVKDNGEWYPILEKYIKTDGTWKKINDINIKIGGEWIEA